MSKKTKRRIPWNKGKVGVYSEEYRKKLSMAKIGIIPQNIKDGSLAEFNRGKKRPPFSKEWRARLSASAIRVREHKQPEQFKNRKGENHPRWKGGVSRGYKTGYYSAQYIKWRKTVFERDNYTCVDCGQAGGYLTAHHIKSFTHYPKLRFIINNGVTLCEDCHKLTDNYKGRGRKK